MNRTNFEHAFFALIIQIIISVPTGNWWSGAFAGAFFFLGREHAQQQFFYKKGDFEAFDIRTWNLDSILDLIFPLIAVLITAFVVENL